METASSMIVGGYLGEIVHELIVCILRKRKPAPSQFRSSTSRLGRTSRRMVWTRRQMKRKLTSYKNGYAFSGGDGHDVLADTENDAEKKDDETYILEFVCGYSGVFGDSFHFY